MLDWNSCQICYPLEIKLLLQIKLSLENVRASREEFEGLEHPMPLTEFQCYRPILSEGY